jgi:DNA polymerase-3 subunit epsilon
MTGKLRFALAVAAAWAFVVGLAAAAILLVAADANEADGAALGRILGEHAASLVLVALLALVALVLAVRALARGYVTAPAQLAEDVGIMLAANPGHRAGERGAGEMRRLAAAVNGLAEAREALRSDVDARVSEANARIAQERNRLAALMSELAQSVIVCNVEGRILLYNARAMQLLRQPIDASGTGKAHSLVGLGRSIFAIFDRNLIIHALDSVRDRLAEGVPSPVASFVTTAPAGQLLRAQLAPVGTSAGNGAAGERGAISGFVVLLDNITRRIESGNRRDLLLQTLTQGTRASLGSIRAAVETIAAFPDMEVAERERFIAVIGEEAQRLSARLDETVERFADSLRTEWPLEEMRGADLIAAARKRIDARLGLPTKLEDIDGSIWLNVDSYSLMQAVTYLASRLREEFGVRELRFNLAAEGTLAHLDLIWTGAPISSETTMAWQTDSMELGGEA